MVSFSCQKNLIEVEWSFENLIFFTELASDWGFYSLLISFGNLHLTSIGSE